ncbi:MAG: hypothetical protein OEW60_08285 [Thiovulaceae bacterium]|nr:hypothetical protein [Sulfurimonadaceae bacterium]
MAIDNSLFDLLEPTYYKIKDYLEQIPLETEHSSLVTKLDAFADLLESFDAQALEKKIKAMPSLQNQLNAIKNISNNIVKELEAGFDSITTAEKVARGLDSIFVEINTILL